MSLRSSFLVFAVLGTVASSALAGAAAAAQSQCVSEKAVQGLTIAAQGARDPAVRQALEDLRAEAARVGSVDIVVKMAVPYAPEGFLREAERHQQRREIAAAAQRLRKAVPQAQGFSASEDKPYVRLTASAADLSRLAKTPGVVRAVRAEDFNWLKDMVQMRLGARNTLAGAHPSSSPAAPRIVGGNDAAPTTRPFQVGLLAKGIRNTFRAQYCGGTLIAPRFVVTAAHCTEGIENASREVDVLVGTQRLDGSGRRIPVKRVTMHPSYDPDYLDYDVAVWELDRPVTGIPFATLAATEPSTPGTPLRVTGWGTLEFGGSAPVMLQQVDVPFVPASEGACQSQDGITPRMICAGTGGKDSCQGDSGGPLTIDRGSGYRELVGIVSFGNACAVPDYPGVYSNVANSDIRGFITNIVPEPAQISLSSGSATVSESARDAKLTVTRSDAKGKAKVKFTVVEGSAKFKSDYKTRSGFAVFRPGSTTATISIRIVNDRVPEYAESFTVNLTGASGGYSLSGITSATVTITDDDQQQLSSARP